MTQKSADMTAATECEEQSESVKDSFTRLYNDGRAYATAEIERQKLRASIAATGVRDAIIFGMIGIVLGFASLVAGMIGIILVLASRIGAGWATLSVVGTALFITLLLLMVAKIRLDRMRKDIG